MKILLVSDETSPAYYDYYKPGKLDDIDLILSCGDLPANYLEFLVTMGNCPLLYVPGNHDTAYEEHPPEGCVCIDDAVYEINGLRILGLGGSMRYQYGATYQYTEEQMRWRVRRLGRALRKAGGVDILMTHAPARGVNDGEDFVHRGFETFNYLLDRFEPQYFFHGHVHLNYNYKLPRKCTVGNTTVINAFGAYVLEIETTENGKKALV